MKSIPIKTKSYLKLNNSMSLLVILPMLGIKSGKRSLSGHPKMARVTRARDDRPKSSMLKTQHGELLPAQSPAKAERA